MMMALCMPIPHDPSLGDMTMILEPIGINNPLLYHPDQRLDAPSSSSQRPPLRAVVSREKIVVTSMFDARAAC